MQLATFSPTSPAQVQLDDAACSPTVRPDGVHLPFLRLCVCDLSPVAQNLPVPGVLAPLHVRLLARNPAPI